MHWLHSRGGWLLSKVLIPSSAPPRASATCSALIWCFKTVLGFLYSRRLNSLFWHEKRLENNDFKPDSGDWTDRLKAMHCFSICQCDHLYLRVFIWFCKLVVLEQQEAGSGHIDDQRCSSSSVTSCSACWAIDHLSSPTEEHQLLSAKLTLNSALMIPRGWFLMPETISCLPLISLPGWQLITFTTGMINSWFIHRD